MSQTVAKQPGADEQGKGAGGDGQQKQYVPIERLEEEIEKRQTLETRLAELSGKLDGLTAATTAPKIEKQEPARFTRAQLREAVDQGKITQAESDAIWDDQQAKEGDAKLAHVADKIEKNLTEKAKIGGQIDRYKELIPDLGKKTSDSFKKVADEYAVMTGDLGMPKNEKTELAALRAVFGPIETLQAKATAKDTRPDTHRESLGRGGGQDDGQADKDGAPRDMPAKLKAHYQRMIDRGIYREGWNDPALKEELKHVRSGRQRAA